MGNIIKRLKFTRMGANPTLRTVVPNHMIAEDSPPKEHPNQRYATNKIKTNKYSILSFLPKNLFEQFHRFANLYFVFIVLLNWVPAVNAFGKEVAMIPLLFVLSVTSIKDGFEDYRRYRSDKKINNLSCRLYSKKQRGYERRTWQDIRVGDVVHLSCNEVIPADIILLHSSDESGICHIDTSNLDGENNLKQRQIVWGLRTGDEFIPPMFTHTIECEMPNMQIRNYQGAILTQSGDKVPVNRNNILLRGCIIRNTDFVEGIVVYAGHDTKALMNNRGPRHKRSKLERQINRDVIWCVVALFLMCFMCSLGAGLWQGHFDDVRDLYFIPYDIEDKYNSAYNAFLLFWTYIILFQVMIPISLYVTIELVKLGQVFFIQEDKHLYYEPSDKRIECRALNITEDLGQIEYVFSDKTGTLTENMMVFKRCSIAGTDYFPPQEAKELDEDGVAGKVDLDNTLPSEPASLIEESSILMETTMKTAVSRMSVNSVSGIDLQMPLELRNIQEFFLLMTVCNTVVVSPHAHRDKMDASGIVHDDPDPATKKKKNGKTAKLKKKKNNSPYGTYEKRNGAATPQLDNSDTMSSMSGEGSSSMDVSSIEASSMLHYEAESPDELALVQAACTYGCKLLKRTPDRVVMWLPGEGEVTMRMLHVLPFDSVRKRMSVMVEHPINHQIILYTKGADSAIFSNLKTKTGDEVEEDLWSNTMDHLTTYAKEGLRTLCMAKRVLTAEEYKSWLRVQEAAETALDDRDKKLYDAACMIETNLELLGATGIEDRLQDGVPETIASLRQAGIKVWVLTGDKQETALNIASSCRLISFDQKLIVLNARTKEHAKDLIQNHLEVLENQGEWMPGESMRSRSIRSHSVAGQTLRGELDEDEPSDEAGGAAGVAFRSSSTLNSLFPADSKRRARRPEAALVVDGKTLAYVFDQQLDQDFLKLAKHCNSVLCCRATPFQKSALVKLVRDNLNRMTLAIGDGANDVAMIQTADVGVGISGQEGMQAVMASDFALARFRFLKRLLLVHGHWCYERLAKMTLYMFYKNAVYIFMLMWFQIFGGFSGGTPVDDFNLMFFNLIYTSLPPIMFGVFDRCVSAEMLSAFPELYKRGPKNKAYRKYSYFLAILDATWQSLVEFFVPYAVYIGSGAGIWEFGFTCNSACMYATLLHLCMDTKYWALPHWIGMILSVAVYIAFNMVYGVICTLCSPPADPYWVSQYTMGTAVHWLTVLIVIVLALGPRYVVYAARRSVRPGSCERARHLERYAMGRHQHIVQGYATWSTSTSSASVTVQRNHSNVTPPMANGEMSSPARNREPWKRHRPTNSNGSIGPQNLPKPHSAQSRRILSSERIRVDPEQPPPPSYEASAAATFSLVPDEPVHGPKTSYSNPAYTDPVATSSAGRPGSAARGISRDSDVFLPGSPAPSADRATPDLPPPGGMRSDLAGESGASPGGATASPNTPEVQVIPGGQSSDDLVNIHSELSTENLMTHL